MNMPENQTALITYHCVEKKFHYITGLEYFAADFNSRPLWQIVKEDGLATDEAAELILTKTMEISALDTPTAFYTNCLLKTSDGTKQHFLMGFVCSAPKKEIIITITRTANYPQASLGYNQ